MLHGGHRHFLLAGAERLFAIVLQLSLSILVFIAVKNKRAMYWVIAFAIHCLVDFTAVVLADTLPTAVVEIVVGIMVFAAALLAYCLYRKLALKSKE